MPRGFLQLLHGGAPIELVHELTLIGRGTQCEFPVDSHTMGREHSLIVRRSSGFWIRDLGSSSGTWLARSRLLALRWLRLSAQLDTPELKLENSPFLDRSPPNAPR